MSRLRPNLRWVVVGLGVMAVVVVADALTTSDTVPRFGVLLGPAVAAAFCTPATVAALGALAVAVYVGLVEAAGLRHEPPFPGRLALLVTSVVLVTAISWSRARRERELARARPDLGLLARLREALDAGGLGTWEWDEGTDVVGWDDRTRRLFRADPGVGASTVEEWVGSIHPDDRDRARRELAVAMARGEPFSLDHRVEHGPEVRWLQCRGAVHFDRDGARVGARGVYVDVTDLRRAEHERDARLDGEQLARADLARIQSVTARLVSALTTADVVAVVAAAGRDVLGADRFEMAVVDARGRSARVVEGPTGTDPPSWDDARVRDLDLPGLMTEVLKRRALVRVSDDDGGRPGVRVGVPLATTGSPFGTLAFRFAYELAGDERIDGLVDALAGQAAQSLERVRLFEAEHAGRERLAFLAEATTIVSSTLERAEILLRLGHLAVPRLAPWFGVYLPDGDQLRLAGEHGEGPHGAGPSQIPRRQRPEAAEATAYRTGRTSVGSGGGSGGVLAVPLVVRGRAHGVLSLRGPALEDDPELRALAVELAARAAVAIDHASAYERERSQADALQRAVLPDALPELDGLELAAAYRPASAQVGGDWYDAFELVSGEVALVVGDVAGHGLRAASLMGQLRNAARAYLLEGHDPARTLVLLDAVLQREAPGVIATAVVAVLDPRGALRWANAGHPPPLVVGAGGARLLADPHGGVLGLRPAPSFPLGATVVEHRQLVLLYTDGLVERRIEAIDEGIARVGQGAAALWPGAGAAEVCRSVVDAAGAPLDDDLCVLVVRRG